MDEWDAPPPDCPMCASRTHQEFKPVAIGGSNRARAAALAEDIIANDYHVADFKSDGRPGGRAKVRYKDQRQATPTEWGAAQGVLQSAVAIGRQTRARYGPDGLDNLQRALKDGSQPDLIAESKKRSMRIW